MKMSRLMAIGLVGLVMVNTVHAAEYIALQRAYQAAKDPATRAAIIQRMQAARARAQEGIGKQLAYSRQAIAQRMGDVRSWVINNQGKILAAAAALAAAAIATGAVALEFQERNEILNTFKENGVDVSNPATALYVINLSQLAKRGWNPFMEYVSKLSVGDGDILMRYMEMPGFTESLQKVLRHKNVLAVEGLKDMIPTTQKQIQTQKDIALTESVFEKMQRGQGIPLSDYQKVFGYK